MKENNNKENKILTKREILKKINLIDSRIKKSEQELKLIELKWKKKKDSTTLLKKDFEIHLQLLHTAPEKSAIADKES